MARAHYGISQVHISGYRSARSVGFSPGPVCALVGGPSVGKSNVLAAIWTLLQRGAPAPEASDLFSGGVQEIHMHARLHGGGEISLEARPPRMQPGGAAEQAVPVLFLPAALRSGPLIAQPVRSDAAERFRQRHFRLAGQTSSAAGASSLLGALESLCSRGERGLVLLIEEPELFLRPQAQRYLYRLLRRFASAGNQVLYSTHEPAFLNVGRLEELALVEHDLSAGTIVFQPKALAAEESFRALAEIDAERAEIFLARGALLVEGRTEKLAFPFIFQALGHDVDREGITIVDCGGKPNIPLFINICAAAHIPYVAVHDRDALPRRQASASEQRLNAQIAALAGPRRSFELARDFEAIAGLRGHRHKPARAWRHFSAIRPDAVPGPLAEAVMATLGAARSTGRSA